MNDRQKIGWTCFITLMYFVLGVIGILHHEMWLDEAHHYLLARDSHSLSELMYNARYEGHPLIWNILLLVLTIFTRDPFYMQVLHVIIATTTVFLLLRYAPFQYYIGVMIVFGYFFFYEYNIISRNYAISMLMLVITCILISRPVKNYILIAISLVFLANTHLFSFIASVGILSVLVWDLSDKRAFESNKKALYWSIIILMIGLIVLLSQVFVPEDHFLKHYDVDPYFSFKRIGKAFSIVMKGLYHVPNIFTDHLWNTNVLVSSSKIGSTVPVFLVLFIPLIFFIEKPHALFFFYFSVSGIMVFVFLSPLIVAARHWGFVFLLFVIALWLEQTFDRITEERRIKGEWYHKLVMSSRKSRPVILFSILGVQLFSSAYLFATDFRRPFSHAQTVADYLKKNKYDKGIVVLAHHSSGPAVSMYLDKPLFYTENNDFGTYCKWNTFPYDLSDQEVLNRVYTLMYNKKEVHAIFILNHRLGCKESDPKGIPLYTDLQIVQKKVFSGAILKSENYFVYEVQLSGESIH
jgi:hypothetical protein